MYVNFQNKQRNNNRWFIIVRVIVSLVIVLGIYLISDIFLSSSIFWQQALFYIIILLSGILG
ncbi:MAG: hypothetical protein EAX86_10245 [Candidatus Heimdallarchaeota archaeon]|nr:hypothetical protein [Candidatus Heimdallarchaeota archaeon]